MPGNDPATDDEDVKLAEADPYQDYTQPSSDEEDTCYSQYCPACAIIGFRDPGAFCKDCLQRPTLNKKCYGLISHQQAHLKPTEELPDLIIEQDVGHLWQYTTINDYSLKLDHFLILPISMEKSSIGIVKLQALYCMTLTMHGTMRILSVPIVQCLQG